MRRVQLADHAVDDGGELGGIATSHCDLTVSITEFLPVEPLHLRVVKSVAHRRPRLIEDCTAASQHVDREFPSEGERDAAPGSGDGGRDPRHDAKHLLALLIPLDDGRGTGGEFLGGAVLRNREGVQCGGSFMGRVEVDLLRVEAPDGRSDRFVRRKGALEAVADPIEVDLYFDLFIFDLFDRLRGRF